METEAGEGDGTTVTHEGCGDLRPGGVAALDPDIPAGIPVSSLGPRIDGYDKASGSGAESNRIEGPRRVWSTEHAVVYLIDEYIQNGSKSISMSLGRLNNTAGLINKSEGSPSDETLSLHFIAITGDGLKAGAQTVLSQGISTQKSERETEVCHDALKSLAKSALFVGKEKKGNTTCFTLSGYKNGKPLGRVSWDGKSSDLKDNQEVQQICQFLQVDSKTALISQAELIKTATGFRIVLFVDCSRFCLTSGTIFENVEVNYLGLERKRNPEKRRKGNQRQEDGHPLPGDVSTPRGQQTDTSRGPDNVRKSNGWQNPEVSNKPLEIKIPMRTTDFSGSTNESIETSKAPAQPTSCGSDFLHQSTQRNKFGGSPKGIHLSSDATASGTPKRKRRRPSTKAQTFVFKRSMRNQLHEMYLERPCKLSVCGLEVPCIQWERKMFRYTEANLPYKGQSLKVAFGFNLDRRARCHQGYMPSEALIYLNKRLVARKPLKEFLSLSQKTSRYESGYTMIVDDDNGLFQANKRRDDLVETETLADVKQSILRPTALQIYRLLVKTQKLSNLTHRMTQLGPLGPSAPTPTNPFNFDAINSKLVPKDPSKPVDIINFAKRGYHRRERVQDSTRPKEAKESGPRDENCDTEDVGSSGGRRRIKKPSRFRDSVIANGSAREAPLTQGNATKDDTNLGKKCRSTGKDRANPKSKEMRRELLQISQTIGRECFREYWREWEEAGKPDDHVWNDAVAVGRTNKLLSLWRERLEASKNVSDFTQRLLELEEMMLPAYHTDLWRGRKKAVQLWKLGVVSGRTRKQWLRSGRQVKKFSEWQEFKQEFDFYACREAGQVVNARGWLNLHTCDDSSSETESKDKYRLAQTTKSSEENQSKDRLNQSKQEHESLQANPKDSEVIIQRMSRKEAEKHAQEAAEAARAVLNARKVAKEQANALRKAQMEAASEATALEQAQCHVRKLAAARAKAENDMKHARMQAEAARQRALHIQAEADASALAFAEAEKQVSANLRATEVAEAQVRAHSRAHDHARAQVHARSEVQAQIQKRIVSLGVSLKEMLSDGVLPEDSRAENGQNDEELMSSKSSVTTEPNRPHEERNESEEDNCENVSESSTDDDDATDDEKQSTLPKKSIQDDEATDDADDDQTV